MNLKEEIVQGRDNSREMSSNLCPYGIKSQHTPEADALALLPMIGIGSENQAHTWE